MKGTPSSLSRFVTPGGRGFGRQPRQGTKPIDFDAKRYNNPPIKVHLVFPGQPEMTMVFSSYTIPSHRFVCGKNHESTDAAIQQAVYNILTNTLSRVFPLEKAVKDSLQTIVEAHYNGKAIGNETFRFAPRSNPNNLFTFPAVTKFITQSKNSSNEILCICPHYITETIWDITDTILDDRPDDDIVSSNIAILSPPIREAHLAYSKLPVDSPIKKFSDSCFRNQYGHWNSAVVTYMVQQVDPGPGIHQRGDSLPENSAPSSQRGTMGPTSTPDDSNPTSTAKSPPDSTNVPPGNDPTATSQGDSDPNIVSQDTTSDVATTEQNPNPSVPKPTSSETEESAQPSATAGDDLIPKERPTDDESRTSMIQARRNPEYSYPDDDVHSGPTHPARGHSERSMSGLTIDSNEQVDEMSIQGSTGGGSAQSQEHEPTTTAPNQEREPTTTAPNQEHESIASAPVTQDASAETTATHGSNRVFRVPIPGADDSLFGRHVNESAVEGTEPADFPNDLSGIHPEEFARIQAKTPMVARILQERMSSATRRTRAHTPPAAHPQDRTAQAHAAPAAQDQSATVSPQQPRKTFFGSEQFTSHFRTSSRKNVPRSSQRPAATPAPPDTGAVDASQEITDGGNRRKRRNLVANATSYFGQARVSMNRSMANVEQAIKAVTFGAPPSAARQTSPPTTMGDTNSHGSGEPSGTTSPVSENDPLKAASNDAGNEGDYTSPSQDPFTGTYARLPPTPSPYYPSNVAFPPDPSTDAASQGNASSTMPQPPPAAATDPSVRNTDPPTDPNVSAPNTSGIDSTTVNTQVPMTFDPYAATTTAPPSNTATTAPISNLSLPAYTAVPGTNPFAIPARGFPAGPYGTPAVPPIVGVPAPAVTTNPAPAATTNPAPAVTTNPAPAVTTNPAPAVNTNPAAVPGAVNPGIGIPVPGHGGPAPGHGAPAPGHGNPAPGVAIPIPVPVAPVPGPPVHPPAGPSPAPVPAGGHGGGAPPPGAASAPAPDPLLVGCDWRMHRVDPRNLDSFMVRDVLHGISTLRPWLYPRPETNNQVNHAVRFRAQFSSKADYINAIAHPRLGSEHYTVKSFLYSFPKLPKGATKAQICDFLHRICRHGMGFSLYIPPFATMTHANHTGLWFADLPAHCRDHWAYYDQVLHQALSGSAGNLGDSDLTRHLVAEFSGYQIVWLLANIAGHPGVSISVLQPSMPRQRRDMSFHDYMQNWSHFLHLEHSRGVAYSDVYFVETWLEHLHSTFNDTLKPLILSLLRDCTRDQPVPIHFSPEHLITFICSRAQSIGLYSLSPLTTPAMLTTTSSRRAGSATARQVSHAPAHADVRMLDEELLPDIFASVCSLMATATNNKCDLCQESTHLVASCPILRRAIGDPVKTRRILSAIEGGRSNRGGSTTPYSSPSRSRTPPTSNRAATRALTLDDDDTDEDVSLRQLTDDENESQGSRDDPQDFR